MFGAGGNGINNDGLFLTANNDDDWKAELTERVINYLEIEEQIEALKKQMDLLRQESKKLAIPIQLEMDRKNLVSVDVPDTDMHVELEVNESQASFTTKLLKKVLEKNNYEKMKIEHLIRQIETERHNTKKTKKKLRPRTSQIVAFRDEKKQRLQHFSKVKRDILKTLNKDGNSTTIGSVANGGSSTIMDAFGVQPTQNMQFDTLLLNSTTNYVM